MWLKEARIAHGDEPLVIYDAAHSQQQLSAVKVPVQIIVHDFEFWDVFKYLILEMPTIRWLLFSENYFIIGVPSY